MNRFTMPDGQTRERGRGWTRVVVARVPIECECVHVPEWHEHGVGPCTAPLTDSLGTEYGTCDCAKYREAE